MRNTKIHYDWLIGADGVNSIVGKAIDFQIDKVPVVVSHYQVSEDIHKRDECLITFLEDLSGYFWIFPKGTHLNIGMGGNIKGRELKKRFQIILNETMQHRGEEIYRGAHLIPYNYNIRPPCDIEHNIILCGDAASFVNPITGEGIYFAMKSGKEAAEIILKKRTPDNYPSFSKYLCRVQKLKDELTPLSITDSFNRIFCDAKTSNDTVAFLFSHTIPEQKEMSDKDKIAIYSKF